MLGFKLEMPQREGSLKEKTRPIYLDMQVSIPNIFEPLMTAGTYRHVGHYTS